MIVTKKILNPVLEKREEKLKKDLDGDGKRGESKTHQRSVLGKTVPPAAPLFTKKGARGNSKKPPFPPMAKGKSSPPSSSCTSCGKMPCKC